VLAYHRLASGLPRWPPFDPFNVDPALFRHQLEELARLHRSTVVSVRDVARWLTETGPPLRGSYVLLTFDDGWTHLLQPLSEAVSRGLPAVVFVPTGHLGSRHFQFFRFDRWYTASGAAAGPASTPLGLTDCRRLVAAGVDVQPHGHSHRSLGNLAEPEMRAEIRDSVAFIERELGLDSIAFAYPYGSSRFFDATPSVERALADRGIKLALRSDPGINALETLSQEALRLRRVPMTDFDVGIVFRAKASGYLGFLPQFMSRAQAVRRLTGFAPSSR
jgi:peptidoglycan/xylan/chitin deacetylase (PgdA/CDA1 family)